MTTTKGMFPHAVDSTILGTFRSCPQKFFRQYLQHWKAQGESVHLIAGGAFAEGIEVARRSFYVDGRPAAESVGLGLGALLGKYGAYECPADSAKSPDRMAGALEYYFDNYKLGMDGATPISYGGKRGIEFSFAHPLNVRHPVTGDPILYTGRADMVADAYGGVFVFDEKTTSSLGPTWSRQWDMRSQFTGYCWALTQFGIKPAGAIVRGVSILKTKFDTQQAITYRSEFEIARWLAQVERDLARMIRCWEEQEWDYNLDHACTEYSGCGFTKVCKSPEPEKWLPMYFDKRVWDPILRAETTVEAYEKSWGHSDAQG